MSRMYGICRMLDGSFTVHELKPRVGMNAIVVSADEIKRLHRKDKLCGSGDYAMVEVFAYQEFFRGEELTGEERRLLVPAVTYASGDLKTLYVVPLTVDVVKLPRLSRGTTLEPGGGYFNPTTMSQRNKKEKNEGGEENDA